MYAVHLWLYMLYCLQYILMRYLGHLALCFSFSGFIRWLSEMQNWSCRKSLITMRRGCSSGTRSLPWPCPSRPLPLWRESPKSRTCRKSCWKKWTVRRYWRTQKCRELRSCFFFLWGTAVFVSRLLLFQVPKPPPYTAQLSLKRKHQQQKAQQAQVERKKLNYNFVMLLSG